ncbi:MAG: 3-oxoacyl-ACP synthase III family protein [Pirellulales bacterium]
MSNQPRAAIAGTGSYLPDRVLTNADLEKMVATSNDWIIERTGIRERRIASPQETTASMAVIAARKALQDANMQAADLDLIIVCTVTPDYVFPATACLLQAELGAARAAAFDLEAACSGFLYGLHTARAMILSGLHRNVLVVGAETLSRVIDYTDRGSCILFGDGAGAAVLSRSASGAGVLFSKIASDGSQADILQIPAGGSKLPPSQQTIAAGQHFMRIEGRRVFKFATNAFVDLCQEALQACELQSSDIALVVPHQVNERIIEAAMKRLDFPWEKIFVNIDRYGNTAAASVPIALDEARRQGRLRPGDLAIMLAFGAGLGWSSAVVRM